ncbi:MAG: TolC family protein [Magnetospirillum sp. WYHS-4]
MSEKIGRGWYGASLVAAVWLVATPVLADSLQEFLGAAQARDPKLEALRHDRVGAQEKAKEAWSDWYPEASVNAWGGRQKQNQPAGTQTNTVAREHSLTVTQLLYDFGKTGAAIDTAALQEVRADLAVIDGEQALFLEAVTAYANLIRAHETLQFARQAEANVRSQTGLEEARVQSGGGYTTDVLQAKSQLAGARARQVRAEGQYEQALNRFRSVFGELPKDIAKLVKPKLEMNVLPKTVDEALALTLDRSPSLRLAKVTADISREQVRAATAKGFLPVIEAVGEHKKQTHVDGTMGDKETDTVKVQLKLPFNLGLTALNSIRAAESGVSASESRVRQALEQAEEQVRNAWQSLQTALANWRYLQDQATLANAFLELARKERELGSRSLLDVLNGETTAINALSDASSAEADVTIAAVTLLYRMGTLTRAEMTSLAAAK